MSGGGVGDALLDLDGIEVFLVAVVVDGMEEGRITCDEICRGPSGYGGEGGAALVVAQDAGTYVRVPSRAPGKGGVSGGRRRCRGRIVDAISQTLGAKGGLGGGGDRGGSLRARGRSGSERGGGVGKLGGVRRVWRRWRPW